MKNGRPPVDELGREAAPPLPTIPDVDVPRTREALSEKISHGCARALEIATVSKDITEAVKAATAWFEVLYPSSPNEGYGGKLGGGTDG